MTTAQGTRRTASKPVRQEAAEVIRLMLAEVVAGQLDASPKVQAYLTGLADGLDT